MPSLQDFLLDTSGRLRSSPPPANPPRPPGSISMQGVNPRLVAAVNGGATYLPPGYRVEPVSGVRSGGDPRSHHHKGNAGDWKIIAPDGTAIPHKGEDTTGMYTRLARGVKTWTLENDPSLASKIGYGGAFGTKIGGGGVPDLMHYDLGGSRGNMRPQVQFALLQPLTAGERTQTASATVPPPAAGRPAMPPPSGTAERGRGAAVSPETAMSKLQSLGFNEAQSKAIVGNMVAESTLRPNAVNSKEGSYGLMQWRGERFKGLNEFAQSKGTSWRDPNTQMEYIAHEMRNIPYEHKQSGAFRNATTVEDANRGLKSYLRYGTNTEDKRLQYANAVQTPAGNVAASSVTQQPGVQAINAASPLAEPPAATAYSPTQTAAQAPATWPPSNAGLDPLQRAGTIQQSAIYGTGQPEPPANAAMLGMGYHAGSGASSEGGFSQFSGAVPPSAPQAPTRITVNARPGATSPQTGPQASSSVSQPRVAPTPTPRVTVNAPAARAESPQGRSKLAQAIIDGFGPAGRDLTTYVDPATGHESITGSMGGETINRNLGRTGAGQAAPGAGSMASVRQAVEQVPLPRPRPEVPSSAPPPLGQDPMSPHAASFGLMPDRGPLWAGGGTPERETYGTKQMSPFAPSVTRAMPNPGGGFPGQGVPGDGSWLPALGGPGALRPSSSSPAPPPTPAPIPGVSGGPGPMQAAPAMAASPLQWWQLDPSLFGGGYGTGSFGSMPGGYFGGGASVPGFGGDYGGSGGW